jgi:hypothetical protein
LQIEHPFIFSVLFYKLLVRSVFNYLPIFKEQYPICLLDCLESVCNNNDSFSLEEVMEGDANLFFIETIQRRCRLIKEYNTWIFQHDFGDGESLFLSSRQKDSSLSYLGLEAFFEGEDKLTLGEFEDILYGFIVRFFVQGIAKIFVYRAIKN